MMRSKAYRGVAMEGGVAHWYDARAKKERDENQALARRLAEHLAPGSTVLEVAPGPGYLAIDLAKLGNKRLRREGYHRLYQLVVDPIGL